MWRAVFKTLVFTLVVPGTVTFVVPRWLLASRSSPDLPPGGRPIGLTMLLAGTAIYLWCAWDFAVTGRGTPAPIDPPKKLVARGLYRHVRNPMYLGVLSAILGQALLLGSTGLFGYAAFVALAFHLFVVSYEEPTLRARFGPQYDRYCSEVRRWWPRASPWIER